MAAEFKDVRSKAQRIVAEIEKRKAALTQKAREIERAAARQLRADFPPYFLAPRRAMKSGIPNGRGSGTCC